MVEPRQHIQRIGNAILYGKFNAIAHYAQVFFVVCTCYIQPPRIPIFAVRVAKYNDDELLSARDRTLEALLAMQFKNTGSPLLDGAFPAEEKPGEMISGTRATMYALSALLHVESDQSGVWLGRHNEPFRDPLSDPEAPQPVFTW